MCAFPDVSATKTFLRPPLSRFASRSAGVGARFALAAVACAFSTLCAAAQDNVPLPRALNAPQVRARAFAAARQALRGTEAAEARARGWSQARALGAQPRSSNLTASWQPIGPGSIVSTTFGHLTGRVTALALDPNDATGNTLYVGTTGGGVWKSTNAAGAAASMTFAPLTDTLAAFSQGSGVGVIPSLSIGAVAVQPASTAVILAGTGDPNDATDSYYGEGILRSADGGATWTLATYADGGQDGLHRFAGLSVAGLAWSTVTPSLVVAAFTTSPESVVVGATLTTSFPGIYYSTDAGATWKMASLFDGASAVQKPSLPRLGNAVTSVVWDAQRSSFYAAVRGHGYYASSDGVTWQRMANQPGANLSAANCPTVSGAGVCPIFRGTLAVQPATGDLYAWTVDSSNINQGLWQDLCAANNGTCANSAPVFATRLDSGELEGSSTTHGIAQGDYNLSLAALSSSANGTLLFAGDVDLYRCSLGANGTGCLWRNTTNALNGCNAPAGVAPSQHAIAGLLNGGADVVWLGTDGGLWRSSDGVAETGAVCSATDSSHFENLNAAVGQGGSLAEVVGFAQSPTNGDTLIVGLGANGSAATTAASSASAWTQLTAGEGGFPAIDPNNANNWFATVGAGVNLTLCGNGGSCGAKDFAGTPTIGEAQVSADASLLDAPTMLDPALTSNVLVGTCRVWRGPASSAVLWSTSNAISAPFDGGSSCTATSALVRSVGAGGPASSSGNAQNAGSQVVYAGMAGALDGGATLGGHVFVTKSANTANKSSAWTDVATSPVINESTNSNVFNPGGFDVSSVTVDPHDATGATVYVTIMGLAANTGAPLAYRSTDFGAHWTNITDNLPAVPANALVVDPNDANTVYVATDTGVYVTQAVSTCGSSLCWSQMGTGLPNAPVTSLEAGAKLATGSGTTGMLRAGTYGRGLWEIPLLAVVSATQPGMSVSPTSLSFTAQAVGTQSGAQTITVQSNGSAALNVSTIAMTGDFSETDNCSHQTLAVGSSCTVNVAFAPTAQGARSGLLTVYANVSGGQATVQLGGTGTAPASVVLTPAALTFGATTINSTSAAQIVTVANTGGADATLQTPVLTGDFSLAAGTCGTTLAANTACSLSVTFTPTASGTRNGTLSVGTSAGTQTASLTGIGNSPATDTLAPLTLAFGQQVVSTSSAALPVTLTNSGDTALTLITATSSSSEFAVVNGCGASLAAHATCTFSVSFVPSAVGARTGVLTVGDQFRMQTVALSGTGAAPAGVSLSPASLAFGAIGVGLSATAQTLTLTNKGGSVLNIASVAASGDFAVASSTCGASLNAGDACTLTVVFTPKAAGARAGLLTIADTAGTQTVALSGTGVDFTLAANGATTATVSTTGGSATYPLLLSSNSSVTTSVSLACSGAPAHATCVVTPSSSTLGSSVNVSVVVETGVATAMNTHGAGSVPWLRGAGTWFALMGAPCLLFVRRRRFARVLMALGVAAMLTVAGGCGSSRTIATDTNPTAATPTPAGSYNLSVSATSAGVTHTVGLTLVVQ